MREITSRNNQTYKIFQKLQTKKYRDKLGLYIIEGENLLEEARRNQKPIQEILVRSGDEERVLKPWMDMDKVYLVEPNLFKELADTVTSQGIVATVKKPDSHISEFCTCKSGGNWIILDRLQDPGNIGTIIRTADAAGYQLVVAMKGTADLFSPKVVRAATGSLFRIPIAFADNPQQLTEFALKNEKKLVATVIDADNFYYDEDLRENVALIVGNEGNGICPQLTEAAHLKVKIPMRGNVESLNAAVAAALIMYETMRK